MKKLTPLILLILLVTLDQKLQADYWKDSFGLHTFYAALFGPKIETIIPNLMAKRDQAELCKDFYIEQPTCTHILHEGQNLSIHEISSSLSCGITYQIFCTILQSIPKLSGHRMSLRSINDTTLQTPTAIGSYILLPYSYFTQPDAVKLFILHHELQHHLYNDIANNHLIKIIQLAQTEKLKNQLALQSSSLLQHIRRYVEYRSDTQAMLAIKCPYCLQEVAQAYRQQDGDQAQGTYHPHGYLYAWQFQTTIDQLILEKKCCQHHKNTGKQINLAITDESSMLNRINIIEE